MPFSKSAAIHGPFPSPFPPQVTSVSRKPLSIALEEISANKIVYERVEEPEAGADDDASVEIVDSPPDALA